MLKFKTLTLGVDGQPDDHSFKTPLLELREHPLRGPLADQGSHTNFHLANNFPTLKETLYDYFSFLTK
jgi:hypothetical protein